MIRSEILTILRCKSCGAGVWTAGEDALVCPTCHARYPVRQDVLYTIADLEPGAGPPTGTPARRWYRALSAPGVTRICDKHKIERFVASLGPGACLIDVGSGVKRRAGHAINLDIRPLPNVDIVYDGADLPIRDGVVDGVISTAVLEHVPDAARFVSELYRVLKCGGQFLITAPFMEGFHAAPRDYRRYTLVGLEALFSRFEKVECGLECGPSSALAWILQEWIAAFAGSHRGYHVLKLIAGWLVQPIKYADLVLAKKPYAFKIAAGFYYVGKKPPAAAA